MSTTPQSTDLTMTATPPAAPKRLLSTLDVMALIIGIVIGAGIFSAPALVAANSQTMTDAYVAWGLGGLIALVGALCYAELSTTYPSAGGEYHFLRLAFGERLAFLFAWARLTVIPTGSIALLGYVFGDYASQLLSLGPYSSSIYAALVIVLMTGANIVGARSGAMTQNLLTVLEVGGVLFIIVVGLTMSVDIPTSIQSVPAESTQWGLVLVMVMLTYGGWNEAAYASAEVIGPNRNLPRALFWSLIIITVSYMLVNMAFFRVLGLAGVGESTAVAADTLRLLLGERGAQIISLLIAVSALTSINATIFLGSRTTYAFGQDEPMFRLLGRWHAGHNTPVIALVVQGLIALALVALGAITLSGFQTMVEYTAPVFWLFFTLTGLALIVMRIRAPNRPRPFRVPGYPVTPLVFVGTSAYLLYASVMYTGIGAVVSAVVLAMGAMLLIVRECISRSALSSPIVRRSTEVPQPVERGPQG
jgi:amino acid transporter